MTDDYQRRSYGAIPVGTGEKPGIVVVDFQLGFTDPQYPLGGAPLQRDDFCFGRRPGSRS